MAFDDITPDMFDEGVESENMEEVAELPEESTDEGAKEQETTETASEEPSVQDDKTNSAFAEMRRAKEEAERKAQELEQRIAELESPDEEEEVDYSEEAIDELIDKYGEEDLYEMIAELEGISTNEVRRQVEARANELEHDNEKAELLSRIDELEAEKQAWAKEAAMHEADKTMANDLAEIQKFDPTIKSLADLPESFDHFRFAKTFDGSQMTATEAYFAAKQMEEQAKVKPAQDIGKVNKTEAESEYYTSWDEINAMTSEEKTKNADKIMRSLSRLK